MQKLQRDKIKSPQPNNTIKGNLKQFQITNHLVLPTPKMQSATTREASMKAASDTTPTPTTMEEVTIITPAAGKEESIVTTPTSKKKVTTIFVMKKAKAMVPMTKRPVKKVKEAPKKEEVNTSDEELLEAAKVLEKGQEDRKKQE